MNYCPQCGFALYADAPQRTYEPIVADPGRTSVPRWPYKAPIMALLALFLLFQGCQPSTPGEIEQGTCQVEAGQEYAEQMSFADGCADPPVQIIVDAWYGLQGHDMTQVYPDFEGVYRFDLVSCETYEWHIQWIQGGQVIDSVAAVMAEPDPNSGGVKVNLITPAEGCIEEPEPVPDLYTACVIGRIEQGNEQAAAEYLCCLEPPFTGQLPCSL